MNPSACRSIHQSATQSINPFIAGEMARRTDENNYLRYKYSRFFDAKRMARLTTTADNAHTQRTVLLCQSHPLWSTATENDKYNNNNDNNHKNQKLTMILIAKH